MKRICLIGLIGASIGASIVVHAQDRADIDRTQIIGNRELPKVLMIVPWKKPLPGALAGRPLVSVLDEALAGVDRDVFRREVNYHAQVANPVNAPAARTPPAPSTEPTAARR